MRTKKIIIDIEYLKSLHKEDPELLDEMALPSFFHKNPLVRWITKKRTKKTLNQIELKTDLYLVDFGCGVGVLLNQLPADSGKLIGVDLTLWPAKKHISYVNRNDITLYHSGEWAGKVKDNSLDYIVATEVLEHIDEIEKVLQQFYKKLKPKGRLIVSLPTENAIYKLGRKIAGFSGHFHKSPHYDIVDLCKKKKLSFKLKKNIPFVEPFCLFKLYVFEK